MSSSNGIYCKCAPLHKVTVCWKTHFIITLIPYANFFKIRQIYNRQNAIGGFFGGFCRSYNGIRELIKWLGRKLYEVK